MILVLFQHTCSLISVHIFRANIEIFGHDILDWLISTYVIMIRSENVRLGHYPNGTMILIRVNQHDNSTNLFSQHEIHAFANAFFGTHRHHILGRNHKGRDAHVEMLILICRLKRKGKLLETSLSVWVLLFGMTTVYVPCRA